MPRLIRLYIASCLIGFGVAALWVAAVIVLNVANLGHLITTSDKALVATFAYWVLNGIVFSGVQMVWALFAIAEEE